ncbi:quinone-dependent dihydroorotate dehydrogenase [Sinomicrobium weinanense]|uniref:Dihydroorotate dehydrogenase (quinone) n=1 Tax=Sinomicrobium weinanense TaxID=2842200 RepID=A0A926JUD0_9FLAO|nr:quinone-dependent dihydroorotate dehydrogenase [Sinomicrobium weinanense]MBC9797361.1 quinone-dependent dihydroorotate dehydrogenase [Sinomicrobium weinanense]MBU3123408.1 quinone-dependent dihydroorotate dehydrogenase [Sinomicrobium weinanense]
MYKTLIRPILFQFDPEKVHHFTFAFIKAANKIPGISALIRRMYTVNDPRLEREVLGLKFKNPVGLAAGFDKDARLFNELSGFGFGFIEIGTLTPKPQPGNPRKRLFRLKEDTAIVNRMGFNNGGVEEAVKRLKKPSASLRARGILIGGNIGKNKVTPNENATDDYRKCFEALHSHVDYFVVNVSSPNTPNLRALQDKEPLTKLLSGLQNHKLQTANHKPIMLKIAPDLTEGQLRDIVRIVKDTGIAGIIATNTTISREGLASPVKKETGGLSGKPLKDRSTEVIRFLHRESGGSFPIIGVGGVHSPEDALEKLEAGASLVQVYTGFIYEGPGLVKRINKALLDR